MKQFPCANKITGLILYCTNEIIELIFLCRCKSESIVNNHSQHSLSLSPTFCKFESKTTSDWLNRMVKPLSLGKKHLHFEMAVKEPTLASFLF